MIFSPVRWDFPICQWFGENTDIYKQFWLDWHNGQDLDLPVGTPIYAPIDWVCYTFTEQGGYGLYIRIDGYAFNQEWHRRQVTLAHLSNIKVKHWAETKSGDLVGYSGNTGYSFMNGVEYPNGGGFPHLHWQMRIIDRNGKVLNYDNWYKWSIDIFQKGWIADSSPSKY